jgi:hypothetical protein
MPDDATFERRRRAQLAYADALDAVRAARCQRCWVKAVLRRGVARARARGL